jgi:polynucleotide 5'-kinase involved in rRNA processing
MVLLVNTCGWVDGLGKDILTQILKIVEPDAVVSMKKKVPNQFYEEIRA